MRGHFKAAAPAPALPSSLTSYDILKSLAVIIMIIDHIGYYFYPDDDWLRAVGRIGFPVWFFLIGYARSRRIDYHLIAGAFILLAADVAFSRSLLPVNALFTMIILRVCLDPLMRLVKDNDITLIILTAVLYILFPLTNLYWEYGTLAMLFAICGYLARNGFNKKGYAFMPYLYGVLCVAAFVGTMHEFFQFSLLLDAVNAIGSTAMMAALFFYLPRKENIGFRMETPWIQKTMRFMGSRTLEIYVVHLLLFKAAFAYLCGCTHCSCYLGSIANLLS